MAAHLATWCDATSMKENAGKREGQLLGKLNRQRHRAPQGIIKDDAWVADGESIRALGVPMGNNLDLLAWWTGKYRQVKQRIASWRSTAHMSITGRTLLLQAILYGSVRFWFFTILIDNRIVEYIESDAYHLVWASNLSLLTNEARTSKARAPPSRRPHLTSTRREVALACPTCDHTSKPSTPNGSADTFTRATRRGSRWPTCGSRRRTQQAAAPS